MGESVWVSQRVVQWVVEVCGCVSEPESGPVGSGGVWVCE